MTEAQADRYRLPDPKCRHKPAGRVMAGSYEGAHASVMVCGRGECIEDAMAWVRAHHYGEPVHIQSWG